MKKNYISFLFFLSIAFYTQAQENKNIQNIEKEFVITQSQTDKLGHEHITYQQYYHGVEVQDGVIKKHKKGGETIFISGHEIEITTIKQGSLSQKNAIAIAKKQINGDIYREDVDKTYKRSIKKVIVKSDAKFHKAYKIDIYAVKPLNRNYVYVSTATGEIVRMDDRIHTADANGTAITAYSGTKNIITDSLAVDTFRLRETSRGGGIETYNMQQGFFGSVDFIDNNNVWNNVNFNKDHVATDAHWAAEMFYDYLNVKHFRNSFDNAGAKLITNVHYGSNYGNAFWDGTSVSVGDGDGSTYGPLTTIDIIAHEFTHGIIENTANLNFSYETGALSESFGDIFATAVEFYAKPSSANWTIKEDAHLSGGADHSLSSPNTYGQPDTYLGTNWASGGADNGGVHTNSGVQNFWFYLLVNGGTGYNDNSSYYSVMSIGMADAMAIVYRALTVYHTSSSQYADARNYAIQAAADLFGNCSSQVQSVTNAWHAVGIGAVYSSIPATANFSSNITYSCSLPATVNFTNLSANSVNYVWNFGDGGSSIVANPTHIYTTAGTYTVRLIASGVGCAASPDTIDVVNYITVINGGSPITASCTPAATSPSNTRGITNVTFININKTSGYSFGEDYTDNTCSNQTTATVGNTYFISVTTGYEYGYIWIDYNNDGSFSSTEQVYYSATRQNSHLTTITIPVTAIQNTPVRMRVGSSYYTLSSACSAPYYGQYEDYTVTIIPNTFPPTIDFDANLTTINVGGTVDFTDLSSNTPTAWVWGFTGGTPISSTAQNPTAIAYNTIGSYAVKLKATNSFGEDSLTKTAYINVVNSANMCSNSNSTALTGNLYDSGGVLGNYNNNENCNFLINPGCASSITLSFYSFYSPTSSDVMKIYDGTDASGTLLATYSYITAPPAPVTANSGSMYITWTTNSSSNYTGWEAIWTSVAPMVAPTANFSMPDTVAFNTSVPFNDSSSTLIGSWQWGFGDGNSSVNQNPTHNYTTSSTFNVQLIVDNCFSTDTITKQIVVLGAPVPTTSIDSINVSINQCGDSIIVPVTLYNNGTGDLMYSTNYSSNNGATIIANLQEGFESGNINSWTDDGGGYTKLVTTSNPATGNYCLEMSNAISGQQDGISKTFNVPNPSQLEFKIKNSATNQYGSFILIGENPVSAPGTGNLLYMYMRSNGGLYINNGTYGSYTANQWMHVELKNIDWNLKNFDLFIDGTLLVANLTFDDPNVTYIDIIHLYGWSSTSIFHFDDILIGQSSVTNLGWVTVASDSSTVLSSDSVTVNVTLYSDGMSSGVYTTDLVIHTNDTSIDSTITIPITLQMNGSPQISQSVSCLNFDSLMVGNTNQDSLMLYNTGCDTLFIYGDSSTTGAFNLVSSLFNIPPNDSLFVAIQFSPTAITNYTDTLVLLDSYDSLKICITGAGIGAPIISYSPQIIIDTVFGCNDSVIVPVTIYNTGLSNLTIAMDNTNNSGCTNVIITINTGNWGSEVSYNITNASGNYMISGTGYGNYQTYTDTVCLPFGSYFFNAIDSYGDGWNGGTYEVRDCVGNIIANNNGQIPAGYGTTETVLVNTFSCANNGVFWLNSTPSPTPIPVNDSSVVNITLNSTGLTSGTYFTNVIITSNDPISTADTIPVIFIVQGVAIGEVSSSCVALDTSFVGGTNSDSIYFYNTGCDTLFITGFTYTSSDFSLDTNTTYILPSDSMKLLIYFNPSIIQSYQDTITVNYNGGSSQLCVTGTGVGSPAISYNPTSIIDTAFGCNDSITIPLTIYNTGVSDLTFSLQANSSSSGNGIIIVTGTTMFYGTRLAGSGSITWDAANLAYNCLSYTAGSSGSIGCYNYGGVSSSNYPQVQSVLNTNFGTSYSFSTINNSTALVTGGVPNYDVIIAGYNWQTSGIHTLAQIQNYLNAGGSIILSGSTSMNGSIPFLPYSVVSVGTTSSTFPGPAVLPNHPLTLNVTSGDWGYNSELHSYFSSYDSTAFTEVWSAGTPCVLVHGGNFTEWLSFSQSGNTITASDSITINVTLHSGGLAGGIYSTNIIIVSNDPLSPSDTIPVFFDISNKPCIDFSYAIGSCSGVINLTDQTINTPTSWQWNFGDGSTSTLQNPIKTYTTAGNYSVQLIACNFYSCDTLSQIVSLSNIGGPLSVSCTPSATSPSSSRGVTNVQVNTINNSTGFSFGEDYQDFTCTQTTNLKIDTIYPVSITTGFEYCYVWIDLNNDGDFSSTEQIYASFSRSNNHTFSYTPLSSSVINTPLRMRIGSSYYTIANACSNPYFGQYEDYTVIILPNNISPTANFTTTTTNQCNGVYQFIDQSINSPTSWSWDFGDGNTSSLQNAANTYSSPGIYSVTLIAANAFGADTSYSSITVNTITADFTYNGNLIIGGGINFFSNTPGAIVWSWDFGNGINSSIENPSIAYLTTGIYTVSLTATNGFGCTDMAAYTLTITDPVTPTASFTSIATNQCAGLFNFTDQSTGSPTGWQWNFDDGSTSSLQNPSHTFTSSGVYNVSLTASNATGSNTSVQSVTASLPSVGFTYTGSLVVNNVIQFTGNASSNVTNWLWNFGDGFSATIQNPGYSYNTAGTYEVILMTTDSNGCTAQVTDTVIIKLFDALYENDVNAAVEIYPNPTDGTFFVKTISKKQKTIMIDITNMLGQTIFSTTYLSVENRIIKIDITKEGSGVYFITIKDKNSMNPVVKRVVVH